MRTLTFSLVLLAAPAAIAAQGAPLRDVPVVSKVADSLQPVMEQLAHLAPKSDQGLVIQGMVLSRGGVTIRLDAGTVYPLTPVAGRTMGALYVGTGRVEATPPNAVERSELTRALGGDSAIDVTFATAVLLFADSTWEELTAHGSPAITTGRPDAGLISSVLDVFGDKDRTHFGPPLVGAALNGERSGYFCGFFQSARGQPFILEYDPDEVESVGLLRRASHTGASAWADTLALYALPGVAVDQAKQTTRTAAIVHYAMDLRLPESGGALAYNAQADLTVVPDGPVGPWIPLYLYRTLIGDSARTTTGPAPIWKVKDHDLMWVRLDRRLAAGDTGHIRVWYHGELIDRFGDWFTVDPSSSWYPRPTDGRNLATFDVTFHTPEQYPIVSVGDQVDSVSEPGHMVRTRWVMNTPMRNGAFDLGAFSESELTAEGTPPVRFIYSDRAIHYQQQVNYVDQDGNVVDRGMRTITVTPDRKERERVGSDIQQALKFYTKVFGGPPVQKFTAGPIPYGEGVAFPGMIELSNATFESGNGSQKGFDEFFRAHEVGHQWWGIGVDFASYRDQWLSEGLATFSGIWFMQTGLHDNKLYFDYLEQYRNHIKSVEDAGPVAVGWRVNTPEHPSAYQVLIYEKGAWIGHMLRILMLDLRTMNEDKFSDAMHDYYRSYHGGRASTADFQHVMERHIGIPLDWFFRQYYEGTALPSYKTAWKAETGPDGKVVVHLRVEQSGVPDDWENYIPVSIDLGDNRVARLRIHVKGPTSTLDVPGMPATPKTVTFNDLSGVLAADFKSVGW